MNTAIVFIYGTLKRGQRNHERMKGARWVGPASVRGWLWDIGAFPALVPSRHTDHDVWGELWEVDREHLEELDMFEGCPMMYERRLVDVSTNAPYDGEVWSYVATRELLARSRGRIAEGHWGRKAA